MVTTKPLHGFLKPYFASMGNPYPVTGFQVRNVQFAVDHRAEFQCFPIHFGTPDTFVIGLVPTIRFQRSSVEPFRAVAWIDPVTVAILIRIS